MFDLMAVRTSETQGSDGHREVAPESSVEQSRDPVLAKAGNRNPIGGRPGRTSGLLTAKSTAIKGRDGISGGCAATAIELTSGDLRRAPAMGLRGSRGALIAAQKSAAGIVAGRSDASRDGR